MENSDRKDRPGRPTFWREIGTTGSIEAIIWKPGFNFHCLPLPPPPPPPPPPGGGLTLETSGIYSPQGLPSARPTFSWQPGVSPNWRFVFIPGAVCTPSAARGTWLTRGWCLVKSLGRHVNTRHWTVLPLLCRMQLRADKGRRPDRQ